MDDMMWNALVASVKHACNGALPDGGSIPPPALMPFSAGQMIGIVWLREVRQGQDALTGICEMSTLAATAHADEVAMFWETEDIAVAWRLPPLHPGNALKAVCATRARHVVTDTRSRGTPSRDAPRQACPCARSTGARRDPADRRGTGARHRDRLDVQLAAIPRHQGRYRGRRRRMAARTWPQREPRSVATIGSSRTRPEVHPSWETLLPKRSPDTAPHTLPRGTVRRRSARSGW
jgi:hypothetical protein